MARRATQTIISDSSDSEQGDNDEPAIAVNSSDSSDDSDNDDSSQDGANAGGALLDIEAADSDLEGEDSEESFDEDAYALDGRGYHPRDRRDFPQFMKLPIELRLRVWELFCPDLNNARRVFEIRLQHSAAITWFPTHTGTLQTMTESSRAVLAVHQESRKLALTWFPDTLPICDPAGEVRFNRERDIVQITGGYHEPEQAMRVDEEPFQAEFCAKIINIAIRANHRHFPAYPDEDFDPDTDYKKCGLDLLLLQRFSNLQNVFCVVENLSIPENGNAWLGTDHCHWSRVCDVEDDIYFCWHDPDTPCSREGACAPLRQGGLCELLKSTDDDSFDSDESDDEDDPAILLPSSRPIYKWPMIRVDVPRAKTPPPGSSPGRSGLNLQALFKDSEYPDDWSDESSNNEYESDGIDDLPIDDPQTEDEDAVGSGIEDDTLAMELLSGNNRHDDDESGEDDSDSDVVETGPFGLPHAAPRNGFSPPEESSDSDDSASKSPSKRKHARRVVLDDSDEEEGGGSVANSAGAAGTRGVKRRRIISDDDDDEDDDDSGRPQKRHHRASSSSSDSSLPDSESAVSVSSASVIFDSARPSVNLARKTGRPTVISSDSDGKAAVRSRPKVRAGVIEDDDSDEEDDEEESDDDAPPKTLSLAERLKLHRQANPVSSASEDDSDDEDSGLRYGEGESESEEENSMLDHMAEDGSDGDEDDDDDGY
ncbi:hypothetical protein F5X68DRAFT_260386 [Plectosphaerella plurivora]|uniref:2EXR domain-containing protein n=1 Tax=Plectosphaerella plurivora TaxID=936078 RepID=A0A9P8VEQ4_9PEZI|nr:hypothetical protein F5X68DRAFT_260386 [Plectosphaerella plurivora]